MAIKVREQFTPASAGSIPFVHYGVSIWFPKIARTIVGFAELQPNWDLQHARAISRSAIETALAFCAAAAETKTSAPSVYPLATGNVLIEWVDDPKPGVDLFAEIDANGDSVNVTLEADGRAVMEGTLSSGEVAVAVPHLIEYSYGAEAVA